jgi:hypothetical protein
MGARIHQQELESSSDSLSPDLLQNDPLSAGAHEKVHVRYGSSRAGRGTEKEHAAPSTSDRWGPGLIMPKIRLGPDENVRLRYSVPESGLIEFELDADHPVKTYIVRPRGLELFDEGSRWFKYYGGFPDARKLQSQELRLPFEGPWYLLIVNPNRQSPVNVNYEVHY